MNYSFLCKFRFFAPFVSALWLFFLLGTPAVADRVSVPVGPAMTTDIDPVLNVIDRSERIVYNLVNEDKTVVSYDNTSRGATGRKGKFPDAIFNDADAVPRFILFANIEMIQDLNTEQMLTLRDKFEKSEWIVGVKGFGQDLKAVLNPALKGGGTITGGHGLAVFLYRSPHGLLNELIIAAPNDTPRAPRGTPHDSSSLDVAFQLMRDWHRRRMAFVTDSDDPWTAIQNFEWSGTTTGDYNGSTQTVGTYKFTLSPYWLDSDQDGNDWYRVDFQTISEITNYEYKGHQFGDTSGKCGWWTTKMHGNATVLTAEGQWWDFMPDTSVGSTTTGFSIGGNITTSQAGVTGSYSKSYGTSDVTIEVLANSVDQSIEWTASLSGCGGYSYYPDYHGASSAAKTTYNLDPSFIIAVPQGKSMVIDTQLPSADGSGSWDFVVEKDHVKCDTFCDEIHVHEYKATWYQNRTISCTKTGC